MTGVAGRRSGSLAAARTRDAASGPAAVRGLAALRRPRDGREPWRGPEARAAGLRAGLRAGVPSGRTAPRGSRRAGLRGGILAGLRSGLRGGLDRLRGGPRGTGPRAGLAAALAAGVCAGLLPSASAVAAVTGPGSEEPVRGVSRVADAAQTSYKGAGAVRGAAAGEDPGPYGFTPGARSVDAAESTTEATRLELGRTYRSRLPQGGKVWFALALDESSDVYVPVTVVPPADARLSPTAGVRVALQNADGGSCSIESGYFGASRSPRPLVTWGSREPSSPLGSCEGAGPYYLVVERMDGTESSADPWELELAPVAEPPLAGASAAPSPEPWNSASVPPPTGSARRRDGGAGFAGAVPLGPGVWTASARPGRTLYYAVPVDWGQRLGVTVELGSAPGGDGGGYVTGALTAELFNPARVPVDDTVLGYSGRQSAGSLDPLPPVRYGNRSGDVQEVRTVRFAGTYYLAVHLSALLAEEYGDREYGVTLRVRVDGTARSAPAYAGKPRPGDLFDLTGRESSGTGAGGLPVPGGGTGTDGAMRALAAAGLGGGTLLLAVLGVWTVVARRRGRGAGA